MQTNEQLTTKTEATALAKVREARERLAAREALGMVKDGFTYRVHLDGTISRR